MKKALAVILTLAFLLSLAGCAGTRSTPTTAAHTTTAAATTAAATTAAATTTTAATTTAATTAAANEISDTITIVDHNGDTVTLPREINRVVVCDIYPLPSVLTLFLGSAEKIVGIHPVSMTAAQSGLLGELYPEILSADTSFMKGTDLNLEELLKLKPDVVFYSSSSTALGTALKNAGISAVGVSATKWKFDILETYSQWIALLSEIFPGHDVAQKVTGWSEDILELVSARTADIPEEERAKILFLYKYDETTMITSGKRFFGQYWCEAVGGINVAEEVELEKSTAVIGMEQVYAWNPEVIFITNFMPTVPDVLYKNAIGTDDWSKVDAVENKRVYKMPLGSYRTFTPGPDTPITLLWMAIQVYPELFEDIDLNERVRAYYQDLYGVTLTDDQITRMFDPSPDAAKSAV